MKQWEYINVRTRQSKIVGVDQPPSAGNTRMKEWQGKAIADFLCILGDEGWDLYGFQQSMDGERVATFFLRRHINGRVDCREFDRLTELN